MMLALTLVSSQLPTRLYHFFWLGLLVIPEAFAWGVRWREERQLAIPRRNIADEARARARGEISGPHTPPQRFRGTVRRGTSSRTRRDLYFLLVEGSWLRAIVIFLLSFLLTNVVFAGLYALDPGGIGGSDGGFADAFSFSVQTMSTIGFGALSPVTPYVNAVVAVEAAVTMLGVAVMTGFVVAKATRPQASVLFSNVVVVTRMNGRPVLKFRVGNERGNDVVDANITVSALVDEVTQEGHHFRRVRDLKLQRSRTPIFSLSWAVVHEIDEESPLWQHDWSDPEGKVLFLVVTLTGHDGTYGQTIYARYNYMPSDVRVGHRFVDVLEELEDGRMLIDYRRFHDTFADDEES